MFVSAILDWVIENYGEYSYIGMNGAIYVRYNEVINGFICCVYFGDDCVIVNNTKYYFSSPSFFDDLGCAIIRSGNLR